MTIFETESCFGDFISFNGDAAKQYELAHIETLCERRKTAIFK